MTTIVTYDKNAPVNTKEDNHDQKIKKKEFHHLEYIKPITE